METNDFIKMAKENISFIVLNYEGDIAIEMDGLEQLLQEYSKIQCKEQREKDKEGLLDLINPLTLHIGHENRVAITKIICHYFDNSPEPE